MKKLTFLIIYLGITLIPLSAQKFTTAYVTDVNYLLRNDATGMVDSSSFPFYFHYQEFIDDIHAEIRQSIFDRYLVDSVNFLNPGKVNYSMGLSSPKTNAKEYSLTSDRQNVFISVETIVALSSISNGLPTYVFLTRVKAFSRGRKVFKFKYKIPFTPVIGDDIVNHVEIGEFDFYDFYFDGLRKAFIGTEKKDQKRYVLKPPTSHYNDFLAGARKVFIVPARQSYLFGLSMDSLKQALVFNEKYLQGLDRELDFGNLFEGNKVYDTYHLQNKLSNEEFIAKIEAGENTLFNLLTISTDTEIVIRNMQKQQIGEFTFEYGKLEGTLNNKKYFFKWNPMYFCTEVSSDKGLEILINDLGDRKVIFIAQTVSEVWLHDFVNAVFVYEFAAQALAEAEAKASNDRDD